MRFTVKKAGVLNGSSLGYFKLSLEDAGTVTTLMNMEEIEELEHDLATATKILYEIRRQITIENSK